MRNTIEKIKGFKIVPDKFRSSTIFNIKEYHDDDFEVELVPTKETQLEDYTVGDEVEIFGLGDEGLIYFVSTIDEKNDKILKIKYPKTTKNIQRREYSRVKFDGTVEIEEFKDAKIEPVDISAGGLKFYIDKEISQEQTYKITLELKNNIRISCDLEILKTFMTQDKKYDVRARFLNLKSVDRIALIQYSFQVLLENENK